MQAVSLNYRDLMLARGDSGTGDAAFVPASDGAGVVEQVGHAVRTLKPGDRVISTFFPDWIDGEADPGSTARALGGSAPGVLAETVIAPEQAWTRAPTHMDALEASTLPCAALTAWQALFEVGPALSRGDSVLLLGTGGVSIWALQLAKAAGLRVIITSSDEAKLARARSLGADHTVNYRSDPEWQREVLRLTGGRGVDRVLEVGGPDTLPRSIEAVRMGGSVVVIGRLTGTAPVAFEPAALFGGFKRLVGVMVGNHAMAARLTAFVEQHAIHPVVDRVFDFDEVPEAYRHLASAGHFGKLVIRIGADPR